MKKFILSTVLSAAVLASSVTGFAAEIPGESLPDGAAEEAVKITESIMGSILDEVYDGLGYGAASGRANTLIRQAVENKETDNYGYGILSAISQNAIRYAVTVTALAKNNLYY